MKPKNPKPSKADIKARDLSIKRIRKAGLTLDTLPFMPSALLQVALTDFNKFRRGKNNRVSMSNWHSMTSAGDCFACLAGAVIHHSLKNPKQTLVPAQFSADIESKLLAIDSFRQGIIYEGLDRLNIPRSETHLPEFVKMFEFYPMNPTPFINSIEALIKEFEEDGL